MVGAKPSFTQKDILLTFLHLKHQCSRSFLVHAVGVGEGTMRSILDILKQKQLIESSAKGHELTQQGKQIYNQLLKVIEPPKNIHSTLYKSLTQSAIVLKTTTAQKISLESRDEAIRNKARAALVLTFNETLNAPGVEQDLSEIKNQLQLQNNNVVIVTFADNEQIAQKAALAVAMSISSDLSLMTKKLESQ